MEDDTRRVSDELRHKHIRTLELLRQLIDENKALRKRLKLGSSNDCNRDNDTPETEPLQEQVNQLNMDLQSATETKATAHQEVARVTEELREAKLQTRSARTAEEASKLTLVALQARNAQFEEEKRGIESRHREQAERSQMELVELREQLASTIADAQGMQARAKLDVSRLELEVEELRCTNSQTSVNRVGSAWTEDFDDDETSVSQRGVEELHLSLRKARKRALTSQRRCSQLERQSRDEVRQRQQLERELHALHGARTQQLATNFKRTPSPIEMVPLPSTPRHQQGRLSGADITRKGKRSICPTGSTASVKPPPAGGRAAPEQAPFPPLPSSAGNGVEGVSQPPRPVGPTTKAGQSGPGSGIRRLREDEKILRDKNVKLQRELKLNAKRLEKAEGFASALEAELQRVAGDGATFEAFVVLRRENHNLKTQLAEIKQAHAMVLASSASRKVNIAFADSIRRQPGGNYGGRCDGNGGGGGGGGRSSPPLKSSQPLKRSVSNSATTRGRTAPLSAACLYKRGSSAGGGGGE